MVILQKNEIRPSGSLGYLMNSAERQRFFDRDQKTFAEQTFLRIDRLKSLFLIQIKIVSANSMLAHAAPQV
jgi:hypothetical protein